MGKSNNKRVINIFCQNRTTIWLKNTYKALYCGNIFFSNNGSSN